MKKKEVLKSINFKVSKGEKIALVGFNDAGKYAQLYNIQKKYYQAEEDLQGIER